jgi:hypothetical protein
LSLPGEVLAAEGEGMCVIRMEPAINSPASRRPGRHDPGVRARRGDRPPAPRSRVYFALDEPRLLLI